LASSQSAQVRTRIWLLSSEPGLVRERLFNLTGQAQIDGGLAADMPGDSVAVSS
jgi:hypothetical protein